MSQSTAGACLALSFLTLACQLVHAEDGATAPGTGDATMEQIEVRVEAQPEGAVVSPYLASANCHGLGRHCLDNDAWDRTMRRVFGGNLLVLLEGAYKQPDAAGNWWDFEAIDTFIRTAKDVWETEELMFLPQWWIRDWNGTDEPTAEQFDTSRQALTQLVQRYGAPGPLCVRYWVACDEWSGAKYWQANPGKFASYYARLVREIKAVNPELLVGGPVDAWPSSAIIRALLKACPELDFIAWNLFICGKADFPLEELFPKTAALEREVLRTRELSREILGKELPVMVSSYNMNFHAWDPPDTRMASPIGGVWNALALIHLARAGTFSGVMYNVIAKDCGMFGPHDGYAVRAGMLPESIDPELITVRPLTHVHEFFKRNIAGARASRTETQGDPEGFAAFATVDAAGSHAVVLVNSSNAPRRARLQLHPFERTAYAEFDLPTEYLYCDQAGLRRGTGLFFSTEGGRSSRCPGTARGV